MNNYKRRSLKKKHSLLVLSLNRRHKRKMTFEYIFRDSIEKVLKQCNYGLNLLSLSEEQNQ
jgi:hypothetical protein